MAFVKMDNGCYLKDPCFMGDGWFIRCSDDEGLMMVVRSRARTIKSIKGRMRKILRDAGIDATLLIERGYQTTTAFPPSFVGLVGAWKWGLVLVGPMPDGLETFPRMMVRVKPSEGELIYG